MKKILLTLFLLIMSLQLFAAKLEGIKIGDLKYDLDTEALTAEVTYGAENVNYSNSNYVKGDVVIPSNVICYDKTYNVIGIGQGAFSGCDKLESLTLPSSITYIKGRAFSGCSSLQKIEISDLRAWCNIDYDQATSNPLYYAKCLYLNGKEISDLILPNSIEEIKPMAFAYFKNLQSVTISDSVVTIGAEVFANCDSIRRVAIGSSVTSIGKDAFKNCPIESLSLRCNKILSWFAGFDTLKNIEIGNSVTIIGSRAFYSCKGITSLYIPASITSIEEEAFRGCTNLTSIEISDLEAWCNIDYSTSSSNPLYYAKRLYLLGSEVSDLILPNSIKEIKPMTFAYCESIQSVTIPDSVTAVGSEVFVDCKALTNVSIGRSITSIGKDALKNCPIESLTLACPIVSSWFSGFKTIKTINLESSVLSLGKSCFSGCTGITDILIPESVTSIDNLAFNNCTQLKHINIPQSVSSISYRSFSDCFSLSDIEIPNSVLTIGDYAFQNCRSLTSIIIPNSVTSVGRNSFNGCTNLKKSAYPSNVSNPFSSGESVVYPKEETIVENGFIFDSGKKSLYFIPYNIDGEYIIPEGVTHIGDKAFISCDQLSTVIIPSSVINIGNYAFYACTNLRINRLIIQPQTQVGNYAFNGCTIDNLICLCIPNAKAFSGMKGNLYVLNKFYSEYNKTNIYPIISVDTESTNSTIRIGKCSSHLSEVSVPSSFEVEGVTYNYDGKKLIIPSLSSGRDYCVNFSFLFNGEVYSDEIFVQTEGINIDIRSLEEGPTSLVLMCEYDRGDAIESIVDEYWESGEKSAKYSIIGLQPSTRYNFTRTLELSDGKKVSKDFEISTLSLSLKTLVPQCTTDATAVVAAETNICDKETNAGFQWIKYDAPLSLQPKEGFGVVYEGRLEGQINNLQSTSYYNVRAFYKSSSGKYYYGDWITFDPSDFSYLDPTVRTYENPIVEEDSVVLTGSVLCGSDEIITQGFQYWSRDAYDVFTVFAAGLSMKTSVNNLSSGEYLFRAFAETSKGYYYGEEYSFKIITSNNSSDLVNGDRDIEVIGYYNPNGIRFNTPQKGFNIILFSNGSTQKIIVK